MAAEEQVLRYSIDISFPEMNHRGGSVIEYRTLGLEAACIRLHAPSMIIGDIN